MLLPSDLKVFKSLVDARLVEIQANKSELHMQPKLTETQRDLLKAYNVFESLYIGIHTRIIEQMRHDTPAKIEKPAHLHSSACIDDDLPF